MTTIKDQRNESSGYGEHKVEQIVKHSGVMSRVCVNLVRGSLVAGKELARDPSDHPLLLHGEGLG